MRIEKQIADSSPKPTLAVHKFTSCDGCQLAFLNLGEALLTLSELVDFTHFAEAGPVNPEASVDIAFVEGSISTPDEEQRIKKVRENCKYLITIGACATAGGLQALRNSSNMDEWRAAIYPSPEHIDALETATPIKSHVRVDFELWGCPVSPRQTLAAVRSLLSGVKPVLEEEKVCLECKRLNTVCVMVAKGLPCMGPVTQTGCGAICPALNRDCYACFGPAENINTFSLTSRLHEIGLSAEHISRRYWFINNFTPEFQQAGHNALVANKHDSKERR
ncbi:MAG: sulfhydrogenase subunit delta [Gammaproteobacteria bacterium]|jgi:coenzyme F420-reducing hydrogenase gamma subunit|nr:sulfhydrogenase subunit delta [Gammaproteobacteria bacterium]